MGIRKIKSGKKNFVFNNKSFSNRRNWGHKTVLTIDGEIVAQAKIIYLNRTWEEYQYQSAMKQAIRSYISELKDITINSFKEENNIKRLSSEKRRLVVAEFKKNNKHLYNVIKKL